MKARVSLLEEIQSKLLEISEKTLWGGECAANILMKNLTPANYTIYTNATWQSVGKSLKLVPDDNGKVELLRFFITKRKIQFHLF